MNRFRQRPARERPHTGEHLVDHRRGSEQIRTFIDLAADQLLGRHVVRRAGDAMPGVACLEGDVLGRRRLGQAEIEQLHPIRGQEHVGGFEVAVKQPAPVQRGQRVEHRTRDREHFRRRHRTAHEPRGQRFAVEQLHHQKGLSVDFVEFVQRADVGVAHACRRARLPSEPFARRRVGQDVRPDHLDRHRPVQPFIMRRVDDAHAAPADETGHTVSANSLEGHPDRGYTRLD